MSAIGKNQIRVDATAKVTGQALYPGDFALADSLVMKVLFARKVHARVRSIQFDDAMKVPGVVMILTAADVPNNEYGLGVPDQPVLCGPGSTKAYGDRVRFYGDQVALVIAEDEESAVTARDLIQVEYEDLPVVTDVIDAMQPEAPVLHPDRGDSNVFCRFHIRKGDVDAAFSSADVVLTADYTTPVQEHAYLQPEAGVAYLDEEKRITVVVGGQWTHEDQEQIAHALKLPLEQIRVIYPAIGGAFGGREDMSVQIILALAVMKLKEKGIDRPVKVVWNREESIIGHHKRHEYRMKTTWAATREGKIIAVKADLVADGGAYVYTSPKVLGNATLMCTGPYEIPNVWVDSCAVYTNNLPAGAFRGFGGPQGAFLAECQMNKLAELLDIDPVEIRRRNLLTDGKLLSVGTPLPEGVSITQVVNICAEQAGWTEDKPSLKSDRPYLKRGRGFGCSFKNIGFSYGYKENCWATIELQGGKEIEKAILRHSGAEVGQGAHTVFIQMAAEALGLPVEKVSLVASDTAQTLNAGSVSASRMTFMAGNAIIGAAKEALEKWKNEERPALAEFRYWAPETSAYDPVTGYCTPNVAYGYVAEVVECEVDTRTGKIEILSVTCADDVGKAINPVQVEGQIEGAVVQAMGYSIHENFIQKNGVPLTDKFSTYLIPSVLDIPREINSIILEYPEPRGPFGVRGMGEMPYLPFAPALVAAVHDATGIWFDDFPLTPEKVFFGVKNAK